MTEKSSKSKIAWHISDGDTVTVLAVHLKPSETEYYSLNYLMFNYNELWCILSNKYMCKQKKKGSFNTRNFCFSLINCCFSRFMLIESVICFQSTVTTIHVQIKYLKYETKLLYNEKQPYVIAHLLFTIQNSNCIFNFRVKVYTTKLDHRLATGLSVPVYRNPLKGHNSLYLSLSLSHTRTCMHVHTHTRAHTHAHTL